MDLMDVPEPGASADPWGAGARARAGAGAGPGAVAGAAAVAEDPWQPYGIYTYTSDYIYTPTIEKCLGIESVFLCRLCSPPAACRTVTLC